MAATVADNLADLPRATAVRAGSRTALIADERSVTWSELDSTADSVAAGLRARGLGPGDRVALALGTTIEFVETYLGTLRAGCVAVPVNTGLTAGEVARVLADSGSRLIVAGGPALTAVRQAISGPAGALTDAPPERTGAEVPGLVVTGAPVLPGESPYESLTGAEGEAQEEPAAGGEDLATLLYTSGTSGHPRAAMLSHRALLADIEAVMALDPPAMRADDVVLGVLPLFHVYGLNAVLGVALRTGATLVLTERFDGDGTLELVRRHMVTNVPAAPPVLVAWAARDDLDEALAGVRLVVSGAAPLPVAVLEQVETASGAAVHEGYGLTETAPVLTTTLASRGRRKPGSVGRPLPGVDLRLVDEDGHEVEEGDPGEVVVRGPMLFSGYWPDGSGGPDARGWWRTGDVAYADEDGDLYLVDRVKELVIVSGFNVYPAEVEEVLVEHPGVAAAAVIGVPHPATGEAVKAFVVPVEGVELSVPEVLAHARARLARFKCPTVVQVVGELPYSATGKVAKGRLRARERVEAELGPGLATAPGPAPGLGRERR
ncbi:MAG TPA: AMP-binding protein [Jiangellales bacterium]|nr:AMP-binding protein [Jiangellales bacterium]